MIVEGFGGCPPTERGQLNEQSLPGLELDERTKLPGQDRSRVHPVDQAVVDLIEATTKTPQRNDLIEPGRGGVEPVPSRGAQSR